MIKKILFIHQSSELYGSDKTLLDLLKGIDRSKFNPYVILPYEGLLSVELEKCNIEIFYLPVMKISRGIKLYNFIGLIRNLYSLLALYRLDRRIGFDIIYTNTLASFLGGCYSIIFNKIHIWHIHEIIQKPKFISKFFAYFTEKTSIKLIFNSNASYNHMFSENSKISEKSTVIFNGVTLLENSRLKAQDKLIYIGLIGRIHSWKGQELLLRAFYNLTKKYDQIRLKFIGSAVKGLEFHKTNLEKIINQELYLNDKVQFIEFTKEIGKIYSELDIVVVPSIEPEPFGMVTIEAMNHMRPVLAAGHGGTLDIIQDNACGVLFEPNNQIDLEDKLSLLILDSELREKIAKNGYQRVKDQFDVKQYVSKIEEVYESI